MEIKINENYANPFVTTTKGFIIKKDEVKEADLEDLEIIHLLEQHILVVVKKTECSCNSSKGEACLKCSSEKRAESEKVWGNVHLKKPEEKPEEEKMLLNNSTDTTDAVKEVVNKDNNPQENLKEVNKNDKITKKEMSEVSS